MVAAPRPKPIDKQELCRKVTSLLKKAYHPNLGKHELPVLETLLFGVCLEDSTLEAAEASYQRLLAAYPDLNEARVSSISELEKVFQDQDSAPWRALRTKSVLQFAFDANYAFELEAIKRKTVELAGKQLEKIPSISWFIRGWSLQNSLGSHVLPLDARMHALLAWMGFTDPDADPEQTSESLRPYIRKADGPLFCHLLRCLAQDPKRSKAFYPLGKGIEHSASPEDGVQRLEALLTKGAAAVPKPNPPRVPTARPPKGESKGESAKGETTKSETAKPESAKPEPRKAEAGKADSAKADAAKADSGKAEGGKAEGGRGEGKATPKTEAGKAEIGKNEVGKSVTDKPAAKRAGKSAAAKGTTKPDTARGAQPAPPSAGKPAVGKADSKGEPKGEAKKRN